MNKLFTILSVVLLAAFASCTMPGSSTKTYQKIPVIAGAKAPTHTSRNISLGDGEAVAPELFSISPVVTGWVGSSTPVTDGEVLTYTYFGATLKMVVHMDVPVVGAITYTTDTLDVSGNPTGVYDTTVGAGFDANASFSEDGTTYPGSVGVTTLNSVWNASNTSHVTAVLNVGGTSFSIDQKLYMSFWNTSTSPAKLYWVYYIHMVIPSGTIDGNGGFTAAGAEYVDENAYNVSTEPGVSGPFDSSLLSAQLSYSNSVFLIKATPNKVGVLFKYGTQTPVSPPTSSIITDGVAGDPTSATLASAAPTYTPTDSSWGSGTLYYYSTPYKWIKGSSDGQPGTDQDKFNGLQ